MTSTEFASLVREKTKTNSVTFSDARILLLANVFIKEIAAKVVERNAAYFLLEHEFDLVANERTYYFPDNMVNRIHKAQFKFSASGRFIPANYIKNYSGSESEEEIVNSFFNEIDGLAYTIRRRGLFLLSGTVPALTDGGFILYYGYPKPLTALNGSTDMSVDPSATELGFPVQFHELLARRVSREFKSNQPKPLPLSPDELNYESELKTQLDAMAHTDESAEIIGDQLSDQDTGNNGWNY